MTSSVLFIHGGGTGAYAEDRLLADALQRALGPGYDVHYPQMPDEENCPYPEWKAEIDARLAAMTGSVALAGHSIGGSILLKYLCDRRSLPRIAGLFALAAPYWGADKFSQSCPSRTSRCTQRSCRARQSTSSTAVATSSTAISRKLLRKSSGRET